VIGPSTRTSRTSICRSVFSLVRGLPLTQQARDDVIELAEIGHLEFRPDSRCSFERVEIGPAPDELIGPRELYDAFFRGQETCLFPIQYLSISSNLPMILAQSGFQVFRSHWKSIQLAWTERRHRLKAASGATSVELPDTTGHSESDGNRVSGRRRGTTQPRNERLAARATGFP